MLADNGVVFPEFQFTIRVQAFGVFTGDVVVARFLAFLGPSRMSGRADQLDENGVAAFFRHDLNFSRIGLWGQVPEGISARGTLGRVFTRGGPALSSGFCG